MAEKEAKSVDKATLEMLEKASSEGIDTAFDRVERVKPCPIGADGVCCKHCSMGPCRVPPPKKKEETPEEKAKRWKEGWTSFYSDRQATYLLIAVTPERMELIDYSRGLGGDAGTWLPHSIEFDGKKR